MPPVTPEEAGRAAVRDHFKRVSTSWGQRYGGRARKISDQDLVLRRANVHRLFRPLVDAHPAGSRLRVVDVGCGTGDVLDGIPRDRIRVTGVDLVPEMVAAAAAAHPDDRFLAADAANLPLEAESEDVVVCLGVLEYVPDPAAVLASIRRALRRGGHLIVSFPNRLSLFRLASRAEVRCERALILLLDALRGRRRERDLAPRYRHTQWSVAQARRLLDSAGFGIDQVLFNTFGLWGHPGTWRPNLAFSAWMSRRFYRESLLSASLATTMVVKATKPHEARTRGTVDARGHGDA